MKWQGLALLGLALTLGACDGGSSGTGITTLTVGNVARVVAASAPPSDSLAGIAVSIDGTDVRDQTDASGAFRLSGDYASEITVRFARAADGLDASLGVNVPAGGTLGLNDVILDAANGTAAAADQSVSFAGTVTGVDCTRGELELVSRQRPDDGDVYVVELASSTIVDQAGHVVPCSAVATGDGATVSGSVNPDGTFGDATVVLDTGAS
jgi:hypothetical protein